jgi:Uma2 family endonuclease
MGNHSEPEPDLFLRVCPGHGGQSSTSSDDYIVGAPEMIIEVAYGGRAIEFHEKCEDYARHGVHEYLVACLRDEGVSAFDLPSGRQLYAGSDGIFRSQVFAGLWIDVEGLFEADYHKMMAALQQGLESLEYAEFARRLAAAKQVR